MDGRKSVVFAYPVFLSLYLLSLLLEKLNWFAGLQDDKEVVGKYLKEDNNSVGTEQTLLNPP